MSEPQINNTASMSVSERTINFDDLSNLMLIEPAQYSALQQAHDDLRQALIYVRGDIEATITACEENGEGHYEYLNNALARIERALKQDKAVNRE